MSNKKYVMALDQGTTSSRALLFTHDGAIAGMAQREFRQVFPRSGWVEHDALEILDTQRAVMREVLSGSGVRADELAAVGITNQRETVVLWERATGRPVHNAIVWQCRRTAQRCTELAQSNHADEITRRTGLVIDAYFSGTKLEWLLDNVAGARKRAEAGELLAGTIDTWLAWNLTERRAHVTDVSNASRTMLFNIETMQWDDYLLDVLNVPRAVLPRVVSCSETLGEILIDGVPVPLSGMAGDQQSALFGQGCRNPGDVKNTYGTGCFLLMNTGTQRVQSQNRLLTTVAWRVGGETCYALEGSVFTAGALIQWLRDELGLIATAAESAQVGGAVEDAHGVYIVPAFSGLGAPYWAPDARGIICGLSRGTRRAHIVRAALEAIAFQSADLIKAMEADAGMLRSLRVDGGASANDLLMQMQADLLGREVLRPANVETTAQGAAWLAGLAEGFWSSPDALPVDAALPRVFKTEQDDAWREQRFAEWRKAVEAALG